MPMRHFRPRRSMLYSPANQLRYLDKAATLSIDCVVMDLEETIVRRRRSSRARTSCTRWSLRLRPARARRARERPRLAVARGRRQPRSPRPAPTRSSSRASKAAATSRMHSRRWTRAGGKHLPVMMMIESPLGVLRAEEIAGASDRIACIVMAHLRPHQPAARAAARRTASPLLQSLSRVLLAGRAHDRSVVDGIQSNLKDMQSFEYACRLGRDLGFDGKTPRAPLPAALLQRRLHAQARGDRRGHGGHRRARAGRTARGAAPWWSTAA